MGPIPKRRSTFPRQMPLEIAVNPSSVRQESRAPLTHSPLDHDPTKGGGPYSDLSLRPPPKAPGNGSQSPASAQKALKVRSLRNKAKRGTAPIYDVVDELVAAALARWIATRQQIKPKTECAIVPRQA